MCIVATATGAGTLYVVGGRENSSVYLRATFAFDVGNSSWSAASDLQVARGTAGCAVNGDETELFVVGGVGGGGYLDSVEVMNVSTMQWRTLDDTLTRGLLGARVVRDEFTHNLLALGGWSASGYVSTVHVIDATAYGITVAEGSSFDIVLSYTAAVVVKGEAYAFGGRNGASLSPGEPCLFS